MPHEVWLCCLHSRAHWYLLVVSPGSLLFRMTVLNLLVSSRWLRSMMLHRIAAATASRGLLLILLARFRLHVHRDHCHRKGGARP